MIDRDVDKISPFYINQTYEGILDEFFGVKTTCVTVSNKIVYADKKTRKEVEDQRNKNGDAIVTETEFRLASD